MSISRKLFTLAIAVFSALSFVSCEEVINGPKPEEVLGSFTYNGNTYNIRSVVVYPLDNGQTEIWLSETAGYTTVDEIEASVGELVITMQTSKIGEGKQTFEQEGQFIKYDSKVNSGWCSVKCDLDQNQKMISLEFSTQKLKAVKNELEGKYNGPYSEYATQALQNQWAYNRRAKEITSVDYFEMEDGKLTHLELMPIELNFDKKVWQSGNPRFSNKHVIIERLAEMSKSYGTEITIDNRGFGIVEL